MRRGKWEVKRGFFSFLNSFFINFKVVETVKDVVVEEPLKEKRRKSESIRLRKGPKMLE